MKGANHGLRFIANGRTERVFTLPSGDRRIDRLTDMLTRYDYEYSVEPTF